MLSLLSLRFPLHDEAGSGGDGDGGDRKCDSDGEGVVTVDRQMDCASPGIAVAPLHSPFPWVCVRTSACNSMNHQWRLLFLMVLVLLLLVSSSSNINACEKWSTI